MTVERKTAPQGPRSNAEALGHIFLLLSQSPIHRNWRVVEIERNIIPALQHNQYRLYFDQNGRPFGYVSWAWLTKATEERYLAGGYAIEPKDWVGGDCPWFIDWVAPRGGTRYIVRDLKSLRDTMWRRIPPKAIRPNRAGKGQKVIQFGFFEDRKAAGWKPKLINEQLDQ
ncbi:MAG: toxin-activating lysine-acyltransferase [Parvibaculaceae bacterium]